MRHGDVHCLAAWFGSWLGGMHSVEYSAKVELNPGLALKRSLCVEPDFEQLVAQYGAFAALVLGNRAARASTT